MSSRSVSAVRVVRRSAVVVGTAGMVVVLAAQPALARPPAALPATTPGCRANAVLHTLSLEKQLGQLFMVGTPATSASSTLLGQISTYHVGNVMLTGRSTAGVTATKSVTSALQTRASSAGLPKLLVATDQEGGNVQVLRGSGFSTMPTAVTQGTWSTTTLRSNATTWANQLKSAGINMNLAPVMDTVPSSSYDNPPIGNYDRNYGYSSSVVSAKGGAFLAGMRSVGVQTAAKHFPGLGMVHQNTDTTSVVRDTSIGKGNAYINPFSSAIAGHTDHVMMSSAYYNLIDRNNPAVFSNIVMTYLRSGLGFPGVIMTDDIGNAKAVQAWSPGTRAYRFIGNGGDLILTVNPSVLPAMYNAMLSQAHSNTFIKNRIWSSAYRVLLAKERIGLLGPAC
ncbi:glycoside hydrolase family 3 N-terminal domain-containing protein [Luteipulveratus mongoliensis]|uniref:beta-N-acetylhexosaminidase n=1 Tax=Luteipulveratus mongoliensis TaxID=571913 RepID=A0A0K1JQE4_9MICO|nr:glycoside hydrolase family 3 N-terminal domain-containing protein [Luteipulveratus mongoliensis]AKU18944.1 hypothetical protein VV02_14630 [Luteipulveratus mongoliensis]